MSELYVCCPRCRGSRMVSAITRMGNGWSSTISEYFSCPLCHGTGEADRDAAAEFEQEERERIAWENGEDLDDLTPEASSSPQSSA